MSIPRKIAFNTIFSSSTKISWTFVSIIALGLITRYLGADGFGEYTTVLAFFFMFSAISDLGLSQIVLREISYKKRDTKEKQIISTAFTLRLTVSLIIILASFVLVRFLPYSDNIKNGIILSSFGLLFSSGYQILVTVFQKRLLVYQVSIAELVGRVANLAWVFTCVHFQLGLLWILGGMLISWASTFLIVFILARIKVKFHLGFNYLGIKKLLKNALPLGISAIITFIYFRVDTIMLSIMKGIGDVGIYGAAYKIIENVAYFPAMFMGLIMPLYARYMFTNKKKFKRVAYRAFDTISFIAIGISFGIFALAPKIITLIAGEGFEESILVLRILAISILGLFYAQYFNTILITANLQKKLLLIFSICAVLNISANIIFIPQYSYLAAGTISSLTELLVPMLAAIMVIKHCHYFPKVYALLKIILAGILMLGFLFISKNWPIYLQIPLGGGIYLMATFALKAFSIRDFKKIIKAN
ncbi:MAG: flippase [Patescibacteria group bacterium]|nr:flippase [Patescibacteria group bacterium]